MIFFKHLKKVNLTVDKYNFVKSVRIRTKKKLRIQAHSTPGYRVLEIGWLKLMTFLKNSFV